MVSTKPWRFDSAVFVIAAIFCCLCAGMIGALILHKFNFAGFQNDHDFGYTLIGTLCLQGVTWPLMVFFFRQHDVGVREALGFRGPNVTRAVMVGICGAIVILPVTSFLLKLSVTVFAHFGWSTDEQVAVTMFEHAALPWTQVYLSIFTTVIAPVAEEFIFRGVLYPVAKQTGFPRLAFIGVNLLFAAFHCDSLRFLPLFVLGMMFTLLYEATDNLITPMTAHIFFNTINLLVLVFDRSQFLRFSR